MQVIVDSKEIYPLYNDQPVIIEVQDNHTKIVVSDGFHFTKPIELNYTQPSFYYFKVVSPVNDLQLLGGAFIMIFFYLLGFITGLLLIKLVSFIPIFLLLAIYYFNRKSFIQLKQDSLSVTRSSQHG
ncbi:MAG: hypothetical protein E6H07_18705 [Bacteroidetes bacterium]|nr:MAG: hypothetical protein E6H07_18705 [Bacteroidota bacterium]